MLPPRLVVCKAFSIPRSAVRLHAKHICGFVHRVTYRSLIPTLIRGEPCTFRQSTMFRVPTPADSAYSSFQLSCSVSKVLYVFGLANSVSLYSIPWGKELTLEGGSRRGIRRSHGLWGIVFGGATMTCISTGMVRYPLLCDDVGASDFSFPCFVFRRSYKRLPRNWWIVVERRIQFGRTRLMLLYQVRLTLLDGAFQET